MNYTYYYISYAHNTGFGALYYRSDGMLNLKEVREHIIKEVHDDQIIIITFTKVSKYVMDMGL